MAIVDRRPALGDILPHVVLLLLGVLIVALPGPTPDLSSPPRRTAPGIQQAPMPLLPGAHMIEQLRDALAGVPHGRAAGLDGAGRPQ
jgi:sn-glycerol 3-phosphate transport system permease protein